jgi:hypothetical protein
MLKYFAALGLLLGGAALAAQPSSWAVVCTAACQAPDGTTQPAGTTVQKIWWNGVSVWPAPPNSRVTPDTGQAVYVAPTAPVTALPVAQYVARFTQAEQVAAASNPQTLTLWLLLLANPAVDSTDIRVQAGAAALVSAGVVTQARATQILNSGNSSP